MQELYLELIDESWPYTYIDHDRLIVRAIVFDDDNNFYFAKIKRDDEFGKVTLIETSGGGKEEGEDLNEAIHRELKEELGVIVDVICKIGVVSDYYNLIHRHNINNYYLCKIKSFTDTSRTIQEIEDFHMQTIKLSYNEALEQYEQYSFSSLGKLIANREIPVLKRAKEIIEDLKK